MSDSSLENWKHCPAQYCREKDLTSFSTCRYCGAPYDPKKFANSRILKRNAMSFGEFIKTPRGFFVMLAIAATLNGVRMAVMSAMISHTIKSADKSISVLQGAAQHRFLTYSDHMRMGDAFWVHTNTYSACSQYAAAIAIDPSRPDAFEKRALMYDAMGSYALANADRKTATDLRKWTK